MRETWHSCAKSMRCVGDFAVIREAYEARGRFCRHAGDLALMRETL